MKTERQTISVEKEKEALRRSTKGVGPSIKQSEESVSSESAKKKSKRFRD